MVQSTPPNMSRVCPRPCGRLATAAIFISVSVIQLIAGLILLNSKYVYLLSAPNIWTALCNFAVGTLFGVSASVWKSTTKPSFKHATRRKILASLAVSAILMNVTTAFILILGEGNTLLSIHLEINGRYTPKTLASEILAYAYATSICSPILCAVVAIVHLSGLWFRKTEQLTKNREKMNVLETDSNAFNWVYKSELSQGNRSLPKPDLEVLRRQSLETSSSTSDAMSSSSFPIRSNSVPSIKDLDTSLNSQIHRSRAHTGGILLPRLTRQRKEYPEMYGREDTPRSRNGVPCPNNSMTSEKFRFRARSPLKERVEFDNQRNPLKFRIKRRDGVFVLGHGEYKDDSPNDGLPKVNVKKIYKRASLPDVDFSHREVTEAQGRFRGLDHSHSMLPKTMQRDHLNLSPISKAAKIQYDVVADVHQPEQFQEHETPPPIPAEAATSSNVFERFTENLQSSEHSYLRRTSTAASLNSAIDIPLKEMSTRSVHPTESRDHTQIHKTTSGESSHSSTHNSYANDSSRVSSQFDQTELNFETGTSALLGEVVPVRVNTASRRKLSSKLVPVSIPVVPNGKKSMDDFTLNEDNLTIKGENKFDEIKAGFSSFRGDMNRESQLRPRSKSAGKYSEKQMVKSQKQVPHVQSFAGTPPMHSVSNMPTEDSSLSASPAHTSGYISVIEENGEYTKQDLFDSQASIWNPSSFCSASGSSKEKYSPRKKFRAAQRKILDGVRIMSDEDSVSDIVEQFVGGNSAVNKESIAELFYDFIFQKVMEQAIKN